MAAAIIEGEQRIIEDDDAVRNALRVRIRSWGYNILTGEDGQVGLDVAEKNEPDLILLDDILKPSDTALDSLPMIRHAGFKGPIVIISAQVDRFRRAELLEKGADDAINKDDLDSSAIGKALQRLAKAGKFLAPSRA